VFITAVKEDGSEPESKPYQKRRNNPCHSSRIIPKNVISYLVLQDLLGDWWILSSNYKSYNGNKSKVSTRSKTELVPIKNPKNPD
jgi:hypothetical protein